MSSKGESSPTKDDVQESCSDSEGSEYIILDNASSSSLSGSSPPSQSRILDSNLGDVSNVGRRLVASCKSRQSSQMKSNGGKQRQLANRHSMDVEIKSTSEIVSSSTYVKYYSSKNIAKCDQSEADSKPDPGQSSSVSVKYMSIKRRFIKKRVKSTLKLRKSFVHCSSKKQAKRVLQVHSKDEDGISFRPRRQRISFRPRRQRIRFGPPRDGTGLRPPRERISLPPPGVRLNRINFPPPEELTCPLPVIRVESDSEDDSKRSIFDEYSKDGKIDPNITFTQEFQNRRYESALKAMYYIKKIREQAWHIYQCILMSSVNGNNGAFHRSSRETSNDRSMDDNSSSEEDSDSCDSYRFLGPSPSRPMLLSGMSKSDNEEEEETGTLRCIGEPPRAICMGNPTSQEEDRDNISKNDHGRKKAKNSHDSDKLPIRSGHEKDNSGPSCSDGSSSSKMPLLSRYRLRGKAHYRGCSQKRDCQGKSHDEKGTSNESLSNACSSSMRDRTPRQDASKEKQYGKPH